jgi:hypothetical protein
MPEFGLRVEDLKRWLKKLPDETRIYYQRIEDVYFEKHGWDSTVIKREKGDESYQGDYAWLQGILFDKKKNILYLSAHY